jgi:hypothetical protein
MSPTFRDHRRAALLSAARTIVTEARSRRASVAEADASRAFYFGVEAAAQEVLYPELTVARDPQWLSREAAPFRDGYLQTADVLAAAMAQPEFPRRVPLPEPAVAAS